jgi:beta-lactamase regulating signal transducer with metallopeptidase domain
VVIGVALLAYAAFVGGLSPRLTRKARWPDRAPMLAIACYLTAACSVIVAAALAGLSLAVHGTALGGGLSFLVGACVQRLRDTYATPGGTALAVLGLGLAGLIVARTAATGAGRLRAARRATLRHTQTARLVGRQVSVLGAIVVDDPRPTAYCLPGRQPTVVLTTGTLQLLDDAQLAAVLAHERAHLASRHHLLMTIARTGRMVFPFVPLLREADAQVARLAELHADDTAARACDSGPLATALVILATGGASVPAMAAAATDVVTRVTRLLRPAQPLRTRHRLLLRAGVAALAISPVLLALAPALLALALGPVPAA